MRTFAALTLLCSVAALLGARFFAIGPLWYASLYALPLAATLLAVAAIGALFEYLFGAAFRPIAAALAVALMLFALLYTIFEGAPGVLPETELRLDELPRKAASIAALGAALGAAVLALYASRSPLLVPQLGVALTLGAGLLVARQTVLGFGLPFLSGWSSGLVAVSLFALVLTAGMRRRGRAAPDGEG